MADENTRVDFNAPSSLVERADRVVDILDISRTQLLTEALEKKLERTTTNGEFRRRLGDAYYNDRIDYGTVESILGREDALRMRFLKESIVREPPEPTLKGNLPTAEIFYDDSNSEWTPDE